MMAYLNAIECVAVILQGSVLHEFRSNRYVGASFENIMEYFFGPLAAFTEVIRSYRVANVFVPEHSSKCV